jgi:hypothetical protein
MTISAGRTAVQSSVSIILHIECTCTIACSFLLEKYILDKGDNQCEKIEVWKPCNDFNDWNENSSAKAETT